MKKVFISQPMNGKSENEILEQREKVIEYSKSLFGDDIEIIDSYLKESHENARPLGYLAESLNLLSKANVAVFAKGWEKARGCRIEHECSLEYDIPTVELSI